MTGNMAVSPDAAVLVERVLIGSDISQNPKFDRLLLRLLLAGTVNDFRYARFCRNMDSTFGLFNSTPTARAYSSGWCAWHCRRASWMMRLPSMAKARKILPGTQGDLQGGSNLGAGECARLCRALALHAQGACSTGGTGLRDWSLRPRHTTLSRSFMGKTFWKKNVTANQRMQATSLRPVDPLTLATCR